MVETQKNIETQKEKPIISLTDAAVEKIKTMMVRDGKEGCGLRFGVVTGGCSGLSYDLRFQKNSYENDTILHEKGIQIFVNENSLPFIRGIEIDYIDTLKESGFKYKNPNATNNCGCGTSFS